MTDDADRPAAPPTAPPTAPGSRTPPPPAPDPGVDDYHRIAETVGLLPTLRVRDNAMQLIAVVATGAVGALAGWLLTDTRVFALVGALAGVVLGLLGSGIVLMVLGWVRAVRSRRGAGDR